MISPTPITVKQRRPEAFTMLELMIVLAIMGVLLTTSIPLIYHGLRREPMSQAINDVMEACSQARAQAILSGTIAELVIRPFDGSFSVSAQAAPARETDGSEGSSRRLPKPFQTSLSSEIVIEMLDVNLREFKDEEEARVQFYPNGTTDEFTLILQWENRQWRKISLEILTGLARLEVIR
jgi:prepilin-type N-terminal cleavage/methylation domain-containing protein